MILQIYVLYVWTFILFTDAEYCKSYPGEVKFIRHEVKDENLYIKKYGTQVLSKYRNAAKQHGASEIYHHHIHELLRDPVEEKKSAEHESRGNVSKENASEIHKGSSKEAHHETQEGAHENKEHEKEGVHENKEHEKEGVHENKEHEKEGVHENKEHEKEGAHENKEHEKEGAHESKEHEQEGAHKKIYQLNHSTSESVLPIWKLQVPRHTISAVLAKVENGKYVDKFEFYKEDFESKNLTTYAPKFIKKLDITPLGINTDAWYVVCLNLSVMTKKKESFCQHCTLIRATDEENQKAVSAEVDEDELMANTAEIIYFVEDVPFPIASIKTKITPDFGKASRCLNIDEPTTSFESSDPILKDTVVFVEVKNLLESYEYKVDVTLELKWNEIPPLGLPSPIEARFYLHDEKDLKIPKCKKSSSHE